MKRYSTGFTNISMAFLLKNFHLLFKIVTLMCARPVLYDTIEITENRKLRLTGYVLGQKIPEYSSNVTT